MGEHSAEKALTVFCDALQERTGARCFKEPGHTLRHTGWAHYPSQLVAWEQDLLTRVTPPAETEAPR